MALERHSATRNFSALQIFLKLLHIEVLLNIYLSKLSLIFEELGFVSFFIVSRYQLRASENLSGAETPRMGEPVKGSSKTCPLNELTFLIQSFEFGLFLIYQNLS